MLCIGRLNIVNMSVFSKLSCIFNTIPVSIPAEFSIEIDRLVLKLQGNAKGLD